MFDLIRILIVGFVAGWLARQFLGTRKQGLLMDIGLGVVGSAAGFVLFGILGFGAHGLIAQIIVAFVGAVVVVAVWRALKRR